MSKYEYGGVKFKTKAEIISYVRKILHSQPLDKYLTGKKLDVVDAILKNHDNYEQKVGCGKYKIGVQQCEINPRNLHFYIKREDGTTTDFSYYKAISPVGKESRVKEALRHIVREDTMWYKINYFRQNADRLGKVKCAETGLKIDKKSSNVDHYPVQFDEIVYDWFIINRLSLKDIELKDDGDNTLIEELVDEEMADAFRRYHKEVATYRVVLDKVNQQRPRAKNVSLKNLLD